MAKHDLSAALDLAERLATFANLTPDDAPAFRKRYPQFAPDAWWDWRFLNAANEMVFVWTEEREKVRAAWQTGFSPDDCIELIAAGAKRADWEDDIKAHQVAGEAGLLVEGAEAKGAEFFRKHEYRERRIFDYQRAAMFLHIQPWRASRCEREECRKHFVKVAKGQRFCSKECFDTKRVADKLKWWRESGTKQRAVKNKAKKNRTRK